MSFIHSLPSRSRPTYYWYSRAMMLEGFFTGAAFEMVNFVARKTIGISEFQVTLYPFFMYLGMMMGFLFPQLFQVKSKMRFVFWTSVPCKLLFIVFSFMAQPSLFFTLSAAALFLSKMYVPMNVSVLKSNYPESLRGTIVGHLRTLELVCTLAGGILSGWVLNQHAGHFRWVFTLAAVGGIVGTCYFTRIREHGPILNRTLVSFAQMLEVLRKDHLYLRFQLQFSVSGIANLMAMPLYVLYIVDVLHANYWQIALASCVAYYLVSILTQRWWGRLTDRHPNPILMRAALSFLWGFHPLCYAWAGSMTMIYVAWAWFGFLMAGGQLNWMLSPLYFCSRDDAPVYTTIHTCFNGVRGILAPVLTYGCYRLLGFTYTFCLISCIMFLNAFMLYDLYIRTRNQIRMEMVPEQIPG